MLAGIFGAFMAISVPACIANCSVSYIVQKRFGGAVVPTANCSHFSFICKVDSGRAAFVVFTSVDGSQVHDCTCKRWCQLTTVEAVHNQKLTQQLLVVSLADNCSVLTASSGCGFLSHMSVVLSAQHTKSCADMLTTP